MKVSSLVIERKESYDADYPNMLVGLVQIKGEHGKMEVKLSNAVVAKVFAIIKADVQRVADYNSSQAGHAIDEAGSETVLIEDKPSLIDEPF
jgi:hypothetical protein